MGDRRDTEQIMLTDTVEKTQENEAVNVSIRGESGEVPTDYVAPAIKPTHKDQTADAFSPMLQGTGSNNLSRISTKTATPYVDDITGVATITDGEFKVFFENYNELAGGLRISTHKLLDACAIDLTAHSQYRGNGEVKTAVCIPIEEYMRLCDIPLTKPSKDKTRRRLQEDLETIYSISLEWKERSGKVIKDYAKMRIVTSQGIKRGSIFVNFSPEFAKYLTGAYIMQYPKALFKIDERNPNGYHLGRKLLLHHSIDNNQRIGTANLISVRALLDVCPDIPTYEEVMSGYRHVDRLIKAPFENALDTLDFITWEYSNSKGVPLTKKQLDSVTYADFIALYIRFTVKDFPDQTIRLETRAEEIKTKTKRKKSTVKKKNDKPIESNEMN